MLNDAEVLREVAMAQVAEVGQGFDTITIVSRNLRAVAEGDGWVTRGGVEEKIFPSDAAMDILEQHRADAYRPGVGTWFTATVTIHARGSVDADFDYDNEPQWLFDAPPPVAFVKDFGKFPRDEEHTPAWLAEKLKKGRRRTS